MMGKTVYLIIQEVYDYFPFWAVSYHKILFFRELDIVLILGNKENVVEYLDLLRVIEVTDFNQFSPT